MTDERETTALEATAQALAAIQKLNPLLHALISIRSDEALADARAADDEARDHAARGLLHGVTTTFKDCMHVRGMKTTNGSAVAEPVVATHDSEVVRRARAAGCIILGKNNLSEFCYGATGENPHFGDCNNPWDPSCVPGGSSSGPAAAVAAGMCRLAFGSDTGGSIRIPAAFCGVAGLRPTTGRIPLTDVLPLSMAYDTVGPLAYDVRDIARAFAAVAGYDMADPMSVESPVEDVLSTLSDGISGLRIGLPRTFYFEGLGPAVARAMEAAIREFEDCGARLVDVRIPDAADVQAIVSFKLFAADAADVHHDDMERRADKIGAEVLRRLRLGNAIGGVEYAAARRWMMHWTVHLRRLFQEIDLVLTPTTPMVAPRRSESADMIETSRRAARFTTAVGAAGLPALSLPCGFSEDGLPIGLQLVGPWFSEARVFRAGMAFQARTAYHKRRPSLAARPS